MKDYIKKFYESHRKIIAYQGFPKPRYTFFGIKCIVLEARLADDSPITITCADGKKISVDRLQPEGRKAMDAKSFLNGYKK